MTTPGDRADRATTTLRERALLGQPLSDLPIIDNHCHIGPYAGFYQPRAGADDMVRTMDRLGVARACVFSTLAVTSDMRGGNDLSLAAARAHPDRLLAYAAPDPNRPDEVEAELRRCLDEGAVGIKFHTQLHNYPFDGPNYQSAFRLADQHRLPLISHGVGSAETLRRIARAHPNAHFIVAHQAARGAWPVVEPTLRVALEEPNVYLDLASSVARFGDFPAVVAAVGADRLLWGSDHLWMCPTHQIGRVLFCPIGDEEKRLILGANMERLLATRR